MLYAPGELYEQLTRAHRTRWTHGDELLALILEQLDRIANVTEYVHADPKTRPGKVPKPFRYPRPNRPAPDRRPSTIAEIRRFFKR